MMQTTKQFKEDSERIRVLYDIFINGQGFCSTVDWISLLEAAERMRKRLNRLSLFCDSFIQVWNLSEVLDCAEADQPPDYLWELVVMLKEDVDRIRKFLDAGQDLDGREADHG